jgi:hypothetical protein
MMNFDAYSKTLLVRTAALAGEQVTNDREQLFPDNC